MSDIGLTGISTTALNKIGPNGETLPGGVNDTTSSLSPFGPGSTKAINEANEVVKSIDTEAVSGMLDTVKNTLGGLFAGFSRKADLKYPLETEGGAYQARVSFQMFEIKLLQDGNTAKVLEKVPTDNTKGSKSNAKSSDQKNIVQVDDFSEAGARYSPGAMGGRVSSSSNADASGAQATTSNTILSKVSDTAKSGYNAVTDTFTKKVSDVKNSEGIRELGNTLSGRLEPVAVQNAPIVDMYFPLTMQFNDNAQYDNAPLGALGAGVESALQSGAGALEAAISEAGKSFTSIMDIATGNDQLGETAFKLGAARVIDKVGILSSGVANALTLQNRAIINPNVRALFRGVGLREFTFQFKMIARSQRESSEVQQIIKHFREQMYPDVYQIGNADIGFKFPNMFKMTFNYNGVPNRNIPKIHYCYLRTVSTTINPTGGAMRRDGSPNEIDLTLSFVEFKTLNKRDIKEGY